MEALLLKTWRSRGWLACLLWPLAQLYALLMHLRQLFYRYGIFRSKRFQVPVIVVGNVVAGGAGKTPLVISLVRHFQAKGLQVGVVSRGYGRSDDACIEVTSQTSVAATGDEPALIQQATGARVFVARRRIDAVQALLAAYSSTAVVICDDGLQHYELQRDIEIAVFDDRGVGNGWLLPAGPLREPWPGRQKTGIDLVLHTGSKPAFGGFRSTRRLADFAVSASGERRALASFQGSPLVALAGIANPQAFFDMLTDKKLQLEQTIALPDHHDFSDDSLHTLKGRTVLCTEKDAVKLFELRQAAEIDLFAVPLVFLPEPAFFNALDARLAERISQLPSSHGHQTA